MKDPRNLLIGGLLVVAAFLLGQAFRGDAALGQGYPGGTANSNNRMIAVTGTIGSGVSVLWLVDTADPHVAVYQCKGGKTIELVAARKIEWDLKIAGFHDESLLSPEDLRKQYYGSSGKESPATEGSGSGQRSPGSGSSSDEGQEEDKSAEQKR